MLKLTKAQYETLKSSGLDATEHGFDADNGPAEKFADACFNWNTYDEIADYATAAPDEADMANHGITEQEWVDGQRMALELAMAIYEDEQEED